MTEYSISPMGLEFTKRWEGFVDHIYGPPADVPTIGYGTTLGAGVVDPLPETCTVAEATYWLAEDMTKNILPLLKEAAEAGHRDLLQCEIDGLADAGYNLGGGIFSDAHTLGYRIRHSQYSRWEFASALLLYDDPGTIFTKGLLSRREEERAMIMRADYSD